MIHDSVREMQEEGRDLYGCAMVPLKAAARRLDLPARLVRSLCAMSDDEGRDDYDDSPTLAVRLQYELVRSQRGNEPEHWISERSLERAERFLAEARKDPERGALLRQMLEAGVPLGPKVGEGIHRAEDGEMVPSDPKNSWEGKKYVEFEGVDPRFTTVSDAAQLLGVSPRQVQKMIADGKLEAEKRPRTIGGGDEPGGEWAVKLDSLQRLLADRLGLDPS